MLIQRAPADDGWLAVDEQGVVFNIFAAIARLYQPAMKKRAPYIRAALQPTEWFGMRPVRLRVPKGRS